MQRMAWAIAVRYLFSKKSHSAVNIISLISVAGVAVATAAIVIVLSVFNGFSDLASSRLSALDPDFKVTPSRGKAIANPDSVIDAIMAVPGVRMAQPVVEERGLAIYDNQQMPVQFKGVVADYDALVNVPQLLIDGAYASFDSCALIQPSILSIGTAVKLNAQPGTYKVMQLYTPRRVGRINPANPAASFREAQLTVNGVFSVQQQEYDADRVIVPIETARQLLEYTTEATAIEIAADRNVAAALRRTLGPAYTVLSRQQLEEKSFRMIMIEKWVTFLMLAFILVIASFNIITTLSLLILEKRDNMATLRALGASKRMVRSVYIIQGWLISTVGGICGIILGTALSLAQQYLHLIKLSGDPSQLSIDYYPMRVAPLDLLIVLGLVVIVGAATSQITRLMKTS